MYLHIFLYALLLSEYNLLSVILKTESHYKNLSSIINISIIHIQSAFIGAGIAHWQVNLT